MSDERQIIECEIDYIIRVNVEIFEDEDLHDLAHEIKEEIDGLVTSYDPVWVEVDLDRAEAV